MSIQINLYFKEIFIEKYINIVFVLEFYDIYKINEFFCSKPLLFYFIMHHLILKTHKLIKTSMIFLKNLIEFYYSHNFDLFMSYKS